MADVRPLRLGFRGQVLEELVDVIVILEVVIAEVVVSDQDGREDPAHQRVHPRLPACAFDLQVEAAARRRSF